MRRSGCKAFAVYLFFVISCIGSISAEGINNTAACNDWHNAVNSVSSGDSVIHGPEMMPFNTEGEELAPAVKGGILYYLVPYGKEQRNRTTLYAFLLEEKGPGQSFSGKDGVVKKNEALQNVYVNFSLDGKIVLLNEIDGETGSGTLFTGNAGDMGDLGKLDRFLYNSKRYSIGRASISPSGNSLVFSSDMPGSSGGVDLWVCKFEDGKWSVPENLGDIVNTAGNEAMPCFMSETRLCFASEGLGGYGGFDLFYTDWQGNSFTKPVNMGSAINSRYNESGICFDSSTGLCYFASDRRGNYDIYSCKPDSFKTEGKQEIVTKDLLAETGYKNDKTLAMETREEKDLIRDIGRRDKSSFILMADDYPYVLERSAMKNEQEPVISNKTLKPADESSEFVSGDHTGGSVPGRRGAAVKNNGIPDKTTAVGINKKTEEANPLADDYYSIQLMAITASKYNKEYIQKEVIAGITGKCFVVREDGWIKIRTGCFFSYREAYKYATEKKIGKFYIVRMNDGHISEKL